MTKNLRNVLIVLAVAAVVWLVPGGGTASGVVLQVLSILFLAVLAWIGVRLYREHRVRIFSLGARNRAIGYGSLGLALLTLTATSSLWAVSGGVVVWLALIAAACYGVFHVVRAAREY